MIKFFKALFRKPEREKFIDQIQIMIQTEDTGILEEYIRACSILQEKVRIVGRFPDGVQKEYSAAGIEEHTGGNIRSYEYIPRRRAMDGNQMLEAVYALLSRDLDYVIVSNTLDDFPLVGADCLEDALIYSADRCGSADGIAKADKKLCGKLLRLSGYHKSDVTINLMEQLPGAELELFQESYIIQKDGVRELPVYHPVDMTYHHTGQKKMVFVVPIFMAVGGVERNTIEIMRALQNQYEFCVITMERHAKGQGSLNHQLKGLCVANYDLRELVEFDDYFDALRRLREMYHPEVVWLCNNSPWLEANMLSFREIFEEQTIVAQDVYDTKYGWIEYYNTDGMHRVDKYIAVNEKIKTVFMETYGLAEQDIRVIYSAIDDSRIRAVMDQSWNREELCAKYGLDSSKKHIALIGRMTEQKDPIRYLDMIRQVRPKHDEIEFLLVGDGTLSEQVDQYKTEHDLTQCVKRIKFVESTPELFQVLDGLVLTSVYEGLAIVSIEAMCIGVPILSTDTGDLKLFLDQTKGGHIIDSSMSDPENFEFWYSRMGEYKKNAGQHGREILDFFSAVNIAKQYQALFDESEEGKGNTA